MIVVARRRRLLAAAVALGLLAAAQTPMASGAADAGVVSSASNGSSSARTSITLSRPTGTVAGQVMVASIVSNDDDPGFTAPGGWTVVRAAHDQGCPAPRGVREGGRLGGAGVLRLEGRRAPVAWPAASPLLPASTRAQPVDASAPRSTRRPRPYRAPAVTDHRAQHAARPPGRRVRRRHVGAPGRHDRAVGGGGAELVQEGRSWPRCPNRCRRPPAPPAPVSPRQPGREEHRRPARPPPARRPPTPPRPTPPSSRARRARRRTPSPPSRSRPPSRPTSAASSTPA